jgi:hypothetical protein
VRAAADEPDGRRLSVQAVNRDSAQDRLEIRDVRTPGRRLTRAEWDAALPGRGYQPAC